VGAKELEEAVRLEFEGHGEEGVGAGYSQRFAGLVLAAGARALGLAEHEVGGGLLLTEPGKGRDDAPGAVQDHDGADGRDVARVLIPTEGFEREHGTPVLSEGLVEEVEGAVVVQVNVLQIGDRARDGAVYLGLVLGGKGEGLGEAAVLGTVDDAAGHEGDEVVLHSARVALAAERGCRLAGAREADDNDRLRAGEVGTTLQPACMGSPPLS
jgi:hypothetical protein